MVDFGGFEMPLSYPSGTIAEHMACRKAAACFDVSHLGTVRLDGPSAFGVLQATLTNDLGRIVPGGAQYQHLLDPSDASVLDDIIVWWVARETFDVMANASNTSRVVEALGGTDVTDERAVIAVQGPAARERLASLIGEAAWVGHNKIATFVFGGADCLVAGTGYTGEDGVECAVPSNEAPALWRALVRSGVAPAGLGARDTLRLEAGFPLHGHELGPGITPLQAGLGWVVSWDKGEFQGRGPLEAERESGPERRLRGLVASGRRPPRAGEAISIGGDVVGVVTSGNFSPVLGRGIALGFLPPLVEDGSRVEISSHKTRVEAVVRKPPFHKASSPAAP